MFDYQDLVRIFNDCFAHDYKTQLIKGEDEPFYEPATATRPYHGVYFAYGFFSSALHECAHWLLAGDARRQLTDYGYWYVPEGRSPEEQRLFLQVEVKPQALEWILSKACGFNFRLSVDNFSASHECDNDYEKFKQAVYQQVQTYCKTQLSPRANCFRQALCLLYGSPAVLNGIDFKMQELEAFTCYS